MPFTPTQFIDSSGQVAASAAAAPTIGYLPPEAAGTTSGQGMWGAVYTYNHRANTGPGGFTTNNTAGYSWATYAPNNYSTDSNIFAINMLTGNGYSTQATPSSVFNGGINASRQLVFGNGTQVGTSGQIHSYPQNSAYQGFSLMAIPFRNVTSSTVTASFTWEHSSYWASGLDGSGTAIYTPNSSRYSTTTSVSNATISSTLSVNVYAQTAVQSFTIPGNTTIIWLGCASSVFVAGTTAHYSEYNNNNIYGINSLTAGIVCDMRMLMALQTCKFNIPYFLNGSGNNAALASLYTTTASVYGDR